MDVCLLLAILGRVRSFVGSSFWEMGVASEQKDEGKSGSKEGVGSKEIQENKEIQESKEIQENKERQESRDIQESKERQECKERQESKDIQESKEKQQDVEKSKERKIPSTTSVPSTGSKSDDEIGTILWCGSDVYLIIISVILIIFALFSFFGDVISKIIAGFKLLLSIFFAAVVVYAVVKKNARMMGVVMISMLIVTMVDIISIVVSLFGQSSIEDAFFSILFSLVRIAYTVHLFFVANKIRLFYRNRQRNSSLPK